jgi:hypothetical protein
VLYFERILVDSIANLIAATTATLIAAPTATSIDRQQKCK